MDVHLWTAQPTALPTASPPHYPHDSSWLSISYGKHTEKTTWKRAKTSWKKAEMHLYTPMAWSLSNSRATLCWARATHKQLIWAQVPKPSVHFKRKKLNHTALCSGLAKWPMSMANSQREIYISNLYNLIPTVPQLWSKYSFCLLEFCQC